MIGFNPNEGHGKYSIDIDDRKMNILMNYCKGCSDLIVFIHGIVCSHRSFQGILNRPEFQGYSYLLFDLLGFGDSSKPMDFSYSMEGQANICERVIDTFKNKNLHLVGHSMGGAICLLFSGSLYNRVLTYASLEGNLISSDCDIFSRPIADMPYEEYKNSIFEEQKAKYSDADLFEFEKTDPLAVYNSARSLVEWSDGGELLRRYNELECKKAYFFGEENINMDVLNKVRDDEKIMIRSSGHAMMTDNPAEFYGKLHNFMRRT